MVWKSASRRYLNIAFYISAFVPISVYPQEITSYRILNITFNTYQPGQLQVNHGRLIWVDKNPDTDTYYLKYFSGADIFTLDSNLSGVTAAIDNDYVVWNTSSEEIRLFNTKDWSVSTIGNSYNPDFKQPVAMAGNEIAYARDAGSGSEIVMQDIVKDADTVFSEGEWNLEPSLDHGQLAWVQKSHPDSMISNIYFFDGIETRLLTNSGASINSRPLVRDGQVIWMQSDGNFSSVCLFDGDSVITIIQEGPGSIVTGYDLSNGIAIATTTDTLTDYSVVNIYDSDTKFVFNIFGYKLISGLHIDNGLIVFTSGTGPDMQLRLCYVDTRLIEEWGSAQNPVVDDEMIAWTLGDAVSMAVPITYQQLSSGNENGWPQSRFKDNDGSKVIWGNIDGSTNARLFYSDGTNTTQLTDSVIYKDFIMMNDGYAIWRHDFTSLYLYDGVNPPELIIDSLQCENMYLADGSIGFHGFRSDAGNTINQAWVYRINTGDLIQLTFDDSDDIMNGITLVDGDDACWFRDSSEVTMLMLYDGSSKTRLTEFPVDNQFSFMNGKIVWSESINNVYQIILYDVNSHSKTQITNSISDSYRPVTDGSKVVWFETGTSPLIMWYYDIVTGKAHKVANFNPTAARWLWLSNGRVAWSSGGEVCVYDGNVISRLTSSAPFNPNREPYVDQEVVIWNKNNPDPNISHYGQIFRLKLHAHVDFDAENITGYAPLEVSFFNNSFQGAKSFHWDFGDGQISTKKDPVHTYQEPGTYSVTLTVEGLSGETVEKKINLVRVSRETVVGVPSVHLEKNIQLQIYPNPFNSITTIRWELPVRGYITLKAYNLQGVEVATIVNEEQMAGIHEITFDAGLLAGGIYLVQLRAETLVELKVLELIK